MPLLGLWLIKVSSIIFENFGFIDLQVELNTTWEMKGCLERTFYGKNLFCYNRRKCTIQSSSRRVRVRE